MIALGNIETENMDRAAPLNSRKAAPVKIGTVARRGARVHQEYRQLSVLTAKPGGRGDPPLGEDSCAAVAA